MIASEKASNRLGQLQSPFHATCLTNFTTIAKLPWQLFFLCIYFWWHFSQTWAQNYKHGRWHNNPGNWVLVLVQKFKWKKQAFFWCWKLSNQLVIALGSYKTKEFLVQLTYDTCSFFIGPESDHCLPLSLTHWLTHWLLSNKLDWCDPGMWRCQLKTCWGCYCCWC